ncbi:hypothetical protein HYE16_03110 [Mycoplasmopsis bovis]|nr:hypothetical protein HYE16_03110 [Mycoplasmopsis bovis]
MKNKYRRSIKKYQIKLMSLWQVVYFVSRDLQGVKKSFKQSKVLKYKHISRRRIKFYKKG